MSPGAGRRDRGGVAGRLVAIVVAALVLAALGACGAAAAPAPPDGGTAAGGTAAATTAATPASGLAFVEVVDLPPGALVAIARIRAGGPFPYRQDGAVFQNREGLLPGRPAGWYREYTVETPGSADRGPRRIVAGSDGTFYWTDDHYASFREVRP